MHAYIYIYIYIHVDVHAECRCQWRIDPCMWESLHMGITLDFSMYDRTPRGCSYIQGALHRIMYIGMPTVDTRAHGAIWPYDYTGSCRYESQ